MQNEIISRVLNEMVVDLNRQHLMKLKEVLEKTLYNLKIEKIYGDENKDSINNSLMDSFISSKRVEGCSKNTINYYQYTLDIIFNNINKEILHLTTDDIRGYLDNYQKNSKVTKTTVDNIRRVLSTFFKWLKTVRIVHFSKKAEGLLEISFIIAIIIYLIIPREV